MRGKRLGVIINLLYFGIPLILLFLALTFGTVQAAFLYWFQSGESSEQRGLYTIIGDQEVGKFVTKYTSGSMICFDSFNETDLPMEFEQVWINNGELNGDKPLLNSINLYTGRDNYKLNGFSKNIRPNFCRFQDVELLDEISDGDILTASATCVRNAPVSEMMGELLTGKYRVYDQDLDIINSAWAEYSYEVNCELIIEESRNCLPRDYGTKLYSSMPHKHYFGAFTEYNYCDNLENLEFKKQVRAKLKILKEKMEAAQNRR